MWQTRSLERGGPLSREGRQTRVWRRHSLRVYKSGLDTRWPALPDQIPLTPSQQLQTWLLLSEPHQLRENVGLLETAHALVADGLFGITRVALFLFERESG